VSSAENHSPAQHADRPPRAKLAILGWSSNNGRDRFRPLMLKSWQRQPLDVLATCTSISADFSQPVSAAATKPIFSPPLNASGSVGKTTGV
jgi:hypothetical protein